MSILSSINQRIDHWITADESNAAGRMGLFRIIFGLFYLYAAAAASSYPPFMHLPADMWIPFPTFRWLWPTQPPPPILLTIMPPVLIIGLVLLIVGLFTRAAGVMVLISGLFLSGIHYAFNGKIDHGNTFMIAYIPAVMLFSRWGDYYSLDAVLKKRRGGVIPPESNSWVYIWPMRAMLLVASVLFISAGYWKLRGGQWFTYADLLPNILLSQSLVAALRGYTYNPLILPLSQIHIITVPLQFSAILFESFFWLSITDRRVRNLILAMAVLFHAFNNFFLYINADLMLILYMMFIDWKALYQRFWRFKMPERVKALPSPVLIGLTLVGAVLVALAWQGINPLQALVNRAVLWYIATPIALVVFLRAVWGLARDANAAIQTRFGDSSVRLKS